MDGTNRARIDFALFMLVEAVARETLIITKKIVAFTQGPDRTAPGSLL